MNIESLADIYGAAHKASVELNRALYAHGDTPRDIHIALALALDALDVALDAASDAMRAEMDASI